MLLNLFLLACGTNNVEWTCTCDADSGSSTVEVCGGDVNGDTVDQAMAEGHDPYVGLRRV